MKVLRANRIAALINSTHGVSRSQRPNLPRPTAEPSFTGDPYNERLFQGVKRRPIRRLGSVQALCEAGTWLGPGRAGPVRRTRGPVAAIQPRVIRVATM